MAPPFLDRFDSVCIVNAQRLIALRRFKEWYGQRFGIKLINFLKAAGKQGMWMVSINSTPQEAAAAVTFFNGATNNTKPIGMDSKGFD